MSVVADGLWEDSAQVELNKGRSDTPATDSKYPVRNAAWNAVLVVSVPFLPTTIRLHHSLPANRASHHH
jgi:hypothetical protein